MTALPATKTNQLLEAISASDGAVELSPFQIAHIRRDANALMNVDASDAHMVLGALASEIFDVEQMNSHHGSSIALKPGSADPLANYSVSLQRLGFIEESIAVLEKVVALEPENLTFLVRLFEAQYHGLRISGAEATAKLLKQRHSDFDLGAYTSFDIFKRLLGEWDSSEDLLCRQVDLAFAFVRSKSIRCLSHALFVDHEFGDSSMFLSLHVRADVEAVSALGDELYILLDERFEYWNPAHLSISLEPHLQAA